MAADPAPKLVPRPIPGLSLSAVQAPKAQAAPTTVKMPVVTSDNPDQARVLYIHRRATLPPELTQNLPRPETNKKAASPQIQVRQGSVKIIPKAEVAGLLTTAE